MTDHVHVYQEPIPIHPDLTKRAVVESQTLPWQPSPTAGVERRMLERDGGEVARATSIVRYAADSQFPRHTHAAGEEYLVLEGVFSDEDGDHPAGTYVRNPPGSGHAPFTGPGCTIFVKLRQMRPAGEPHVRIDTRRAAWHETDIPDVHRISLFEADAWRESVSLDRLAPGASLRLQDVGGVEVLVIDGAVADGELGYPTGAWLRLPPGDGLDLVATGGAVLWIKRGHLIGG